MRSTYQTEQWLACPVPQVFAFFANPANLPRLMPGWQRARIDAISLVAAAEGPHGRSATPAAGVGTRLTLSFRPAPLLPIRLSWEAEIEEFAWDDHFCDVQMRGPFAAWRHCHRVREERRDGVVGTLLTDSVEYALPLGGFGGLGNGIARRQIRSAFAFRQRRTAELLGVAAS